MALAFCNVNNCEELTVDPSSWSAILNHVNNYTLHLCHLSELHQVFRVIVASMFN